VPRPHTEERTNWRYGRLPSSKGHNAFVLVHVLGLIAINLLKFYGFYSASALLAMQSAVLARGILSVCLSVCPSVRHVPVLCPNE